MRIINNTINKIFGVDKIVQKQVMLAVVKELSKKNRLLNWTQKSIARTRQDVKSWNDAQQSFGNADDPRSFALQLLYNEVQIDALLTSQIENRKNQLLSSEFSLKNPKGDIDEENTLKLQKSPAYRNITNAILDAKYMGYSLIELNQNELKEIDVTVIPRTNITPQNGKFYPDYAEDKYILYREIPEFGKFILEFNTGDIGLLNKAVPHVLFKRFAQSCWSELCEIYGIPPRFLKTNTQDPAMLTRAEQMMRDMGAAAWYIIDETESFEFAKDVAAVSGDVYANLIRLCNNENSMLISGAIIGQDTVHGSNNKDQSAQNVLWELVKSDMKMVEMYWNGTVIPALQKIGYLPANLSFEFEQAEDIEQLWKFTSGALPYYNINPDFIKEKFGVDVIGERQSQLTAADKNLSAFFD
jgi:phage gp29-like protein